MSETNEPVTDRIEAIRARHTSCDYTAIDSQALADIAWLLAVLEEVRDRLLWHAYEDYDADHIRVSGITEALMRHMGEGWVNAAPVAPDAESTEWVWSPGDVILDADLIAWQRDGERIHYPWLAVGQPVQRDQDITEHVTKHGGRVLVCKARGIGGTPC